MPNTTNLNSMSKAELIEQLTKTLETVEKLSTAVITLKSENETLTESVNNIPVTNEVAYDFRSTTEKLEDTLLSGASKLGDTLDAANQLLESVANLGSTYVNIKTASLRVNGKAELQNDMLKAKLKSEAIIASTSANISITADEEKRLDSIMAELGL